MPSADWVFPQIFLNPVDHKYGKIDYASGQLRVAQSVGNCKLKAGAILNVKEPFRSVKTCIHTCMENGDWHNDFHNYTMLWLPDSIKFFVDGNEYCSVDEGEGLYAVQANGRDLPSKDSLKTLGDSLLAPFDKDFYITLGYGVGGIYEFDDNSRKPWRNDDARSLNKFWRNAKKYDWTDDKYKFEIDYIRVYAV
uniref:GH16 domain-containing protein n=1 Tax=Megaselia scalaris TaxID=36166 RepID=T1GRL4_MEGSC